MSLTFDAISSSLIGATGHGGQRNYRIDLSGDLEEGETISSADVTSSSPLVAVIEDVAVGPDYLTFHLTIDGDETTETVTIDIEFIGTSDSADTYRATQPIVPRLEN